MFLNGMLLKLCKSQGRLYSKRITKMNNMYSNGIIVLCVDDNNDANYVHKCEHNVKLRSVFSIELHLEQNYSTQQYKCSVASSDVISIESLKTVTQTEQKKFIYRYI